MYKYIIVILFSAVLTACATTNVNVENIEQSTLEKGLLHYDREEYKEAFELLKPLADTGVKEAYFPVGKMYHVGLGTEENCEKAVSLYKKSIEYLAEPRAKHNLAYIYQTKDSCDTADMKKIKKLYEEAFYGGVPQSLDALTNIVIHSSIPDKEKVINDYKNKRDQIGIDYYELGLKAFEREEYSEAYKHFKAADKVGNLQARSFLSAMHYKGVGVPKNLQKAQELIDSGVTKLDIKHKDVDVTQIMTAYNRAINRRYLEYIYSARGDIFKRYFNDEEMALKDMLQIDINKTENPHALNYAAWIMATSKNTKLRDGEKAVRYAKKAVELDGNKSAFIVDTLAAAYADNGQFGKAVETQKKAIKLFKAEKADADVIKDVEQRIRLFESGKAYRE